MVINTAVPMGINHSLKWVAEEEIRGKDEHQHPPLGGQVDAGILKRMLM